MVGRFRRLEDTRNPDLILQKIQATVYDGAIILFHDIYPETIRAVPQVIDYLQEQGYRITTVGGFIRTSNDCRELLWQKRSSASPVKKLFFGVATSEIPLLSKGCDKILSQPFLNFSKV